MSIIWKGVSGLRWCNLLSTIQELQVKYPVLVPKLLVIQCGGNDIADISLSGLQKFMKRTLREIFEIFPTTRKFYQGHVGGMLSQTSLQKFRENALTAQLLHLCLIMVGHRLNI